MQWNTACKFLLTSLKYCAKSTNHVFRTYTNRNKLLPPPNCQVFEISLKEAKNSKENSKAKPREVWWPDYRNPEAFRTFYLKLCFRIFCREFPMPNIILKALENQKEIQFFNTSILNRHRSYIVG